MPTLPAHPNLDHLRHQAKDLLGAAKAGDRPAVDRIHAVSEALTLAAAQLAVAREYGFSSWPQLKTEVDSRAQDLAHKVDAFCATSVRNLSGRAAQMLAETPEIAGYSFTTAVVLGDAARVRDELARDPGLATRPDPRSGWTALHAVSSSRWHHLDPARADGLRAVAELLLDAGADPNDRTGGRGRWSALGCAVASAGDGPGNEPIIRLLLERGATPEDEDLYMTTFAQDSHGCLGLLLEHSPDVADIAEMALSGPIGSDDLEGVRLMLEAGANPQRFRNDDGEPDSAIGVAIATGASAELVELLLAHGADANAPGADDRSPYRLATAAGRRDVVERLRRFGAREDATDTDEFLSACLRVDRADAQRRLKGDPGLLDRLSEPERPAIVPAAEHGNTEAVRLMLDLGFPLEIRGDEFGATPLHAAAYSGSADTVRLLLERGADLEARDTRWGSTPLEWASVGSGERPNENPNADWPATVRALIGAGASTEAFTLSPGDPKAPSPEVAQLLREHGVREEPAGGSGA